MISKIQDLIHKYGSFENILPEELLNKDFTELELFKAEFKRISSEDMDTIRKLAKENSVTIDFDRFKKIDYIVKMAFYRETDVTQDEIPFYFAHWYMSLVTLDMLTNNILQLSSTLVGYFKDYSSETNIIFAKRTNFNYFVRTWQDFYGYIVNIKGSAYDYSDLFVRTCNKINPNNNENPYYAYKADISPNELNAGVKELLLHGNVGRQSGFSLLRSMIEITVLGKLLDTNDSKQYKDTLIESSNDYPLSVNAICRTIERLGYGDLFKTDTILRLYNWQSQVSHVGYRADDYVTWFIRNICGQLCNLFSHKIKIHQDEIITNLEKTGQIKIKDK